MVFNLSFPIQQLSSDDFVSEYLLLRREGEVVATIGDAFWQLMQRTSSIPRLRSSLGINLSGQSSSLTLFSLELPVSE